MRGDKIAGNRGAEGVTKIKINETSPLVASYFFFNSAHSYAFTPPLVKIFRVLMAHNVVLSFGEIYK
jgi:hypothetical protein